MKKIYVFLIVLVLGFGVVMFLLYGVDSIKREKYETLECNCALLQ